MRISLYKCFRAAAVAVGTTAERAEEVKAMEQDLHQPMELPPGFRFHPTDEELITHYLARKVADPRFAALAVSEADLNRSEPWELPCKHHLPHDRSLSTQTELYLKE
jgi:hypothetical protein